MNKNNVINTLNNYNWNDENINNIKNYILNGWLPSFKTNYQKDKFIQRFKDFVIENDKIIYKPLNLEVVPNNKKDEILNEFYDGLKAIGSGKYNFYKKISSNYLNITRDYTNEFISKQSIYQMNTTTKHIINKPIIASACAERISIDLVSINNLAKHNDGYNQILTAIDYFSKKVWARPLKNKSKENVLDGIKSIIEEMKIKPHIIMSDNGGEFKNYYTINYYKENDIKYIFTLPYAPESNGLIKNFNKQLRKMFREIFIRTNDLNWVHYLQICCDSKNSQFNKTTKHTANELWNQDSFYDNVKTREAAPAQNIALNNSPEGIRIQARENIKA